MRRRRHADAREPTPPPSPATSAREADEEELGPTVERGDEADPLAFRPPPHEHRREHPPERRRDGIDAAPKRDAAMMVRSRELALGLMATGAPRAMVVAGLQERLGLTAVQAATTWSEVSSELRAEYEAGEATRKALQVDRIQRDLARARASADKQGKQVSLRAITQAELLLARITGTLEPVRAEVNVDVSVRDAFAAVLGSLTAEEAERLVEEQLELERRAGCLTVPALPLEATGSDD
jgi:hypothetical protein